jgi:site-specific DNA-methyltransferase (cytosine-N4-specific)
MDAREETVSVNVMNNRTILQGDVLDKIQEIEDESIDCIISSPPYWGLRDYGVSGQWGLEPDFRDYLKSMQRLMRELKRVLKKTGTCWINLGDTYASGGGQGSEQSFDRNRGIDKNKEQDNTPKAKYRTTMGKSRFGIPERFYINCIDDGWIARNHIPWIKSNSMPSSVKDRFTNKWESIFFFAKSQKYYFNLDAVREKTITEDTRPFNRRVRENKRGVQEQLLAGSASQQEMNQYNKKGEKKQDSTLDATGKPKPTYARFNERWKNRKSNNVGGQAIQNGLKSHRGDYTEDGDPINNPKGKNPGDIFFINPRPFPEAHFATFPVDLPLKILKCACPKDGMVLDPFFGAGTTGLAAEKLGLQWVGIELKEEYIKIARTRLAKFSNNHLEDFTHA